MSGPVLVVGATHGTGLLAARLLRDAPGGTRATFAISWGDGPRRGWDEMLGDLRADAR